MPKNPKYRFEIKGINFLYARWGGPTQMCKLNNSDIQKFLWEDNQLCLKNSNSKWILEYWDKQSSIRNFIPKLKGQDKYIIYKW